MEDDMRNTTEDRSENSAGRKQFVFQKLLPYADELDAESRVLLAEIKSNLARAVMLREMYPGCYIWSMKLYKYMRVYGMKFSKEDHILFIKLMYEMITIPNLEPYLVCKFGIILVLLLKKKRLISPDELELPWRPLYDLIYRTKYTPEAALKMFRSHSDLETILNMLLRSAKTYFPLSATQEILDLLRPLLCPLDAQSISKGLHLLELFLPIQLPPKHHSLGYQLWFEDFMTLWEVCHHAQPWENVMMWLMARLANNNIGYINWEPYLPIMFTRFVRSLQLPVVYKQKKYNGRQHQIGAHPIAMWIVSVLGNGSSAQMYLEKFLKTVETYFHSANSGAWLGNLKFLVTKLPYYFIQRVHKERYGRPTWETPIPENYKLTDQDIDAFVQSMMPVISIAMFNRSLLEDVALGLQCLSSLRPNLVIPSVLEQLYSTLDSGTEPLKLNAIIIYLTAIARPMVQGPRNINKGYTYSEGPTHVLPILFSSLPGIDSNDVPKCCSTFWLISHYATFVPIVDSSRSSAAMDEEERMVCEATSRFEDFVLQYLDQVFMFIDSSSLESVRLESHADKSKNMLETMQESGLAEASMSLLIQMSDSIFESALRKLRLFITERIFETKIAGRLAATLCEVFARINGKSTLRALLPGLCQTILDLIGDVEDITKEENLDNRFLYVMLILSALVNAVGLYLLPYVNTLLQILDNVLHLKSREGSNTACNLLENMLLALSSANTYSFQTSEKGFNDPDYPYIRDWGQPLNIDSLRIKWYVPGEEEIAVVQQIFDKYLLPEIEKLQQYCKDRNTLSQNELLTSLNIVRSVLKGCEPLLPLCDEPPLEIVKSSLTWTPFEPTVGVKGEIRMPDGSNVRRYMTGIMSDLQTAILRNAEDDTKSLFTLIEIWSILLMGGMRSHETYEVKLKHFQWKKKLLRDALLDDKGSLGTYIVDRVELEHKKRSYFRLVVITETHKRIMMELLALATSRYANVRSNAQLVLFNALEHFPYSYKLIDDHLIDIVTLDTEKYHDAYKGALYILLGPKRDPIITKCDWIMIRRLWPAIVLSKPSEKFSIIQLKERLRDAIQKNFSTIAIKLEIPDECVKAASALWNTCPKPAVSKPDEIEIQKGLQTLKEIGETNLQMYNSLLDELLHAILEKNLHWRHRLMAMGFMRDLVHPEQKYPPKIVRYSVEALVHDTLAERNIGLKTVLLILRQQKRKHEKVVIDVSTFSTKSTQDSDQSQSVVPGDRSDNLWLQYDYETRPLTAKQWDEPRFIHKTFIGYYGWPKELQVYAPSSKQPCLDPDTRELTDLEKEVDKFFSDSQNIEKLINYLSLEEKKNKEKFSMYRYFLFKNLFRNHGIVYLKHFLPHLHKLVADSQQSSQRCAAEIIAGIIKGAKHWPFQMVNDMWNELLPIIRTALANITVETVDNWGCCFGVAQLARDPNRQHWFLECLMEESPLGDAESSVVQCGRLYALQCVFNRQPWRLEQLMQRFLKRLEDKLLTNPSQNVRIQLATLLTSIFYGDFRFPKGSNHSIRPRVQNFIDKMMPKLQQLTEDNNTIYTTEEQSLSLRVANVAVDDTAKESNTKERETAVRLFKTICKWIVHNLSRCPYGALPGYYEFFPLLCQLENCETDAELSDECSTTLAMLAQAFTLPSVMPVALDTISKMSRNPSWSTRSTCLEFLQVLVFHNMSIVLSNSQWVKCVRDMVLYLLEDDRVEVREKAGQVLGGLLHCTFIPDQEALLEEFKVKAKTRIQKKKKSLIPETETERNAKADAIRIRHAAVLGLCAFVSAHPYDVPKHIPPIFEHLGLHMNDPQPIPTTIMKTLGDFKRTHYNGWTGINGHVQNFTKEQLAVLQDLSVLPLHYA